MPVGTLLVSHSTPPSALAQRSAECQLLGAAALGEAHLHVSSLAGDVLSLGAFERAPRVGWNAAARGSAAGDGIWRRSTGGRAIACGDGFLIATLALPHRAALVADGPAALRPEQVMNRAVRGVLGALGRLGLDPVYPGLDLVTLAGRAVAHLSFTERAAGPTLFQAIVAVRRSFALTPALLDRHDPGGAVPASFIAASSTTMLDAHFPNGTAAPQLDAAGFAALAASAYAETFSLEALDLDPEVTRVLVSGASPEPPDDAPEPPPPGASVAEVAGLLGPVTAWVRAAGGRIAAAGLSGDFIAPAETVLRLGEALVGCPVDGGEIAARVARELDGERSYLLGLTTDALADLIRRAAQPA